MVDKGQSTVEPRITGLRITGHTQITGQDPAAATWVRFPGIPVPDSQEFG